MKGQSLAKSLLCHRKSRLLRGCNMCSSVHPQELSPSVRAHTCCISTLSTRPKNIYINSRFWHVPVSLCHQVALSKEGPEMTSLSLTHLPKSSANLSLPSLCPPGKLHRPPPHPRIRGFTTQHSSMRSAPACFGGEDRPWKGWGM